MEQSEYCCKDDVTRVECWDSAVHCFGTARIFELRAQKCLNVSRSLDYIGIAFPLTLMGVAFTFKATGFVLDALIVVSGVLGLAQLLLSLAKLVWRIDEERQYSLESAGSNDAFSQHFKRLAAGNLDKPVPKKELEELREQCGERDKLDIGHSISDKEKRYGMRCALRQFQRKCIGCGQIATDISSGDCNVCGDFTPCWPKFVAFFLPGQV